MIFSVVFLLYELAWVIILYVLSYKFFTLLLTDHTKLLKVAFNVDIRYFQFNLESATKEQHNMLHVLSSFVTFVILSIHPIVHSLVFVWFRFLDITQLNRLVLYILLLKNKSFPPDAISIVQILTTCINFYDSSFFFQTLLILVDSFFDIDHFFVEISRIHTQLLASDTAVLKKTYDILAILKSNVKNLWYARLFLLVTITLASITYSQFITYTDFAFYVYASYRIATVYTNDYEKIK